jgi:1,4-dihydroxy-2-naphthoyl-CoA synthase
MSEMTEKYSNFKYFIITFPASGIAHVEINRPEKLNAFVEVFVLLPPKEGRK